MLSSGEMNVHLGQVCVLSVSSREGASGSSAALKALQTDPVAASELQEGIRDEPALRPLKLGGAQVLKKINKIKKQSREGWDEWLPG